MKKNVANIKIKNRIALQSKSERFSTRHFKQKYEEMRDIHNKFVVESTKLINHQYFKIRCLCDDLKLDRDQVLSAKYCFRNWIEMFEAYEYSLLSQDNSELSSPFWDNSDKPLRIFENDLITFENESICYLVKYDKGKFDLQFYCDFSNDYNYAGDFPYYDLDFYIQDQPKKCFVIGNLTEGIK